MFLNPKPFNEHVSFAGQPTEAELGQWAQAGFRSVVNLRPECEVERGLSPSIEERICKELGLRFFHLPTDLNGLDAAYIKAASDTLDEAEKPMIFHCAGGARAAILAALLHALSEGESGEDVVTRVEDSGQSFNKDLRQKVLALAESL
jgi:uncharacterized protein (TIGR01244 family)